MLSSTILRLSKPLTTLPIANVRTILLQAKPSFTPTGKADKELEGAFAEMKDAKSYRSKGAYESALQLYDRVCDIVKNFGGNHNPMLHAVHRQKFETIYEWNKVDEMKKLSALLIEDADAGKDIHEQIGNRLAISRSMLERNQLNEAYSLLQSTLTLLEDTKVTSSERLSSYLMLTACDHFMGKNTIVEYLDKLQAYASQSSSATQTAFWNCLIYNNVASIQYEHMREDMMDIQVDEKKESKKEESLDPQYNDISNLYKQACQSRDLLLKDISLTAPTIPETSLESVLAISLVFTNYGHILTLLNMKKTGSEMLKTALKLVEKIPEAKSELSRILGYLAFISFKEDQPVMSEGLYKTSLDTYKELYSKQKLTLQEIHDYADIMKNYGILLTKWDQREKNGSDIMTHSFELLDNAFSCNGKPVYQFNPTSRLWLPSLYKWDFSN